CLVAAAWLHDIGYAPSVRRTGFHPLDGAEFVRSAGFGKLVASLVAFHTGAHVEASERGLQGLSEFGDPPRSRPVEWCKSGRVSACGSVVATMP
ncbi:phosphohydrolase, partial [Mycobacterium avium 10-5560]